MDSEGELYKVIISDDAAQMLISHSRFLAQVSETAAVQLIDEFNEKAKSLEEFPKPIHGFPIHWYRRANISSC